MNTELIVRYGQVHLVNREAGTIASWAGGSGKYHPAPNDVPLEHTFGEFAGVDAKSTVHGVEGTNSSVLNSDVTYTHFTDSTVKNSEVYDCRLYGSRLYDSVVKNVTLRDVALWDADITDERHIIQVTNVGYHSVDVLFYRRKDGEDFLRVGCWEGTLDGLMAEVRRRACYPEKEAYVPQYEALHQFLTISKNNW